MKMIPVAAPCLGRAEAKAAGKVILSGWVTQGPRVKEFESAFAAYTGARYACAVSSCTTALHLALLAVGVRPGDVVITVSHSFIATANAIRHAQAEPVFVDIDPETFNLDPKTLAEILANDFESRDGSLWYKHAEEIAAGESPLCGRLPPVGRLGAILLVHQIGMPADLARIIPLAKKYGVPVIEDAAAAIGSEISLDHGKTWEKIGRPHGEVACFSFHPRKILTTGDGGMLTTNYAAYDKKFRLLRQHAMNVPDIVRHHAEDVIFEEYEMTGYNYRMTDIQAAVGIEQLKRLPGIIKKRRQIVAWYREAFKNSPEWILPQEPQNVRTNWQSFTVRLKKPFDQKKMMQAMRDLKIDTRRAVMCAHLEAPYAGAWPKGCLPQSELAQQSGLILPLYHEMNQGIVKRVVAALHKVACG